MNHLVQHRGRDLRHADIRQGHGVLGKGDERHLQILAGRGDEAGLRDARLHLPFTVLRRECEDLVFGFAL